jgi:hypothetical protein
VNERSLWKPAETPAPNRRVDQHDCRSIGPVGSARTARQIDSAIKQLVVDAHTRASDILRDRRSLLVTLAQRLIEQEVVEGADVRVLVAQASSSAPQAA